MHRTGDLAFADCNLPELFGTRAISRRGLRDIDRVRRLSIGKRVERIHRCRRGRHDLSVRNDSRFSGRARQFDCVRVDGGAQLRRARSLLLGGQPHEWRRSGTWDREWFQPIFIDQSEHRSESIKIARWNWVVLVVVAARALDRKSEEHSGKGGHAIGDAFLAQLFADRSTFLGHAMQSVERARDLIRNFVVVRSDGQQVACNHRRCELVVRHVRFERLQQPIAPGPSETVGVRLVSEGVGEAREIEPRRRAMLGRARACQQRINASFVSTRILVRGKSIDFLERRR